MLNPISFRIRRRSIHASCTSFHGIQFSRSCFIWGFCLICMPCFTFIFRLIFWRTTCTATTKPRGEDHWSSFRYLSEGSSAVHLNVNTFKTKSEEQVKDCSEIQGFCFQLVCSSCSRRGREERVLEISGFIHHSLLNGVTVLWPFPNDHPLCGGLPIKDHLMTKQNNLTPIQMTMRRIAHVNVSTQQRKTKFFSRMRQITLTSYYPLSPPRQSQKADLWTLNFPFDWSRPF